MYTGEMIEELVEMVVRAEEHADARRLAGRAAREEREFEPRFVYVAEAQPMMFGVA